MSDSVRHLCRGGSCPRLDGALAELRGCGAEIAGRGEPIDIDDAIPRDLLGVGKGKVSGAERLKVVVNSIRYENNILPVSLDVYDLDGMAGIYIPGGISRDVSKESANEAISSIGLNNLDPSLGAQAANAGIQTAKALLSKKVKLIQVTIKAGYKVLLKDNNQK